MLKRIVLLSPVIVLLAAGPAHANIIARRPSLPEMAFAVFSVEALLATILLRMRGFKTMLIFLVWFAMTSVTFVLFYMFLSSMENVPFALKAVTGEICVIILEASVLYCLGLSSFFYRHRSGSLEPKHALTISAIANAASILIGFMLTGYGILF